MSSNDTILTMENITKTFGPVKALTDVNLSVAARSTPSAARTVQANRP